jgi:chromosome segregation ATPase
MPNGTDTHEWIGKLQETLTQLQISASNLEQKIDLLTAGMEKLETSMAEMKSITSSQETKLALLEEKCKRLRDQIPEGLSEDLTLMRSQLKNYQKFLWIVATALVAIAVKVVAGSL